MKKTFSNETSALTGAALSGIWLGLKISFFPIFIFFRVVVVISTALRGLGGGSSASIQGGLKFKDED